METTRMEPDSGQPQSNGHRYRCGRRGRGGIAAIVLTALVAGVAGVYVGKSFAQEHRPFAARGALLVTDAGVADERVERLVKHLAVEVDATPEQRQKLEAIAKDAARELAPLRVKAQTARRQAIELLGAASVDRAAIGQLRAEQIRLADVVTQRLSQAIADAADVLTPEQRQKLAGHMLQRLERFERFRGA